MALLAIELVLASRNKFKKIEKTNLFVFAIGGKRKYHVDGSEAMKDCAKAAGLSTEFLSAFNSRNIRIYVSTEFRWMNASPEMQMM